MFSIIIPLYNKASYLKKALNSVFNQTFTGFEVVVVNDGSTDDSLIKLEFIVHNLKLNDAEKSKKIRIINQENQGVSTARNNGVKIAQYDYIVFLDADDWWDLSYLEEMKNLIEDFPHAGIYGCGYYKVRNNKLIEAEIVDKTFIAGEINYCRAYSKKMWMPLTSISTIIKKDLFLLENGFKAQLKLGEDFDLWIRIALKYPIAFLNKPLAYYNQDVDIKTRAVGNRLYEADEHMLFSDYSAWENNAEFVYLFERLAVYALIPYYLKNKNIEQVNIILQKIHWNQHSFKYYLYYKILPKCVLRQVIGLFKLGSFFKTRIKLFFKNKF